MTRLLALPLLAATLWLGAAAGFASRAAAQERTKEERVRAAFTGDAAAALDRLLGRAREQGLPTEPLLDKALEGVAKGVPPGRVIDVVGELALRLGRANALLSVAGRPAAPADIAAVADGLRRGVSEDAVGRLRADAGEGEPIALSVHTLADLLDRGVPVDAALDVLKAWRGQGGQTDQLPDLPAAVERLVRQGALPAQAAEAVAAALRAGRGPAAPSNMRGPPPGRGRGPDGPPGPPGNGPPKGPGNNNKGGNKGGNKPPGGSGG